MIVTRERDRQEEIILLSIPFFRGTKQKIISPEVGESGEMNCFTQDELKLYKTGLVADNLRQKITDHLYACEQCSNAFLASLSQEEIEQAEELLSPNFTVKVETALRQENSNMHRQKSLSGKRFNERIQNLLFYYVGAAVVTLIFMSSGVFQKIVDVAPLVASATQIERKGVVETDEFKFRMPERALDKAALWIENFEVKVKEGINNEEKK